MQILKNPNFKFMNKKYIAFAVSLAIIIAGIISIQTKNGFNLGIDFAGGTLIQLNFREDVSVDKVREELKNMDLGKSVIQKLGDTNEILIKAEKVSSAKISEEKMENPDEVANNIVRALRLEDEKQLSKQGKIDLNLSESSEIESRFLQILADNEKAKEYSEIISNIKKESHGLIKSYEILEDKIPSEDLKKIKEKSFLGNIAKMRVEVVGPQVGEDLRVKATKATVWALVGMLIYIAFRFKFLFGVSALFTLTHDILITLSFISFFDREISLPVIAGILTIVGYSLNDTIVIYDRVRDNLKKYTTKLDPNEILDKSINQTLSRTIITSGTTLFAVLALFIFGGAVIKDFSFTLLVGIISGTYSSVYQSCAYISIWEKHKAKVKKRRKEERLKNRTKGKTKRKKK